MSREELEMWTAKLKLYCILHGSSIKKYYNDFTDTDGRSLIPCKICPLDKDDQCLSQGKLMLWITKKRKVIEDIRDSSQAGKCVEWIKHV